MSTSEPSTGRSFSRLFTVCSVLLIIALALVASWSTKSIIITQPSSRQVLSNALADPLSSLAIMRARSLDPSLEWIEPEGEADEDIVSYITENVLNNMRLNSDLMASDSNLSWIITYKSKEYRHNWKDAYNTASGALSFTIRCENGRTTFTGTSLPETSFERDRTILVNPSLVPSDRLQNGGGEYTYRVRLPEGFSIHFYIPTHIAGNGGRIARLAASLNRSGMEFALIAGSAVIVLFALLWRWNSEKSYRPLRQFVRLKALFAWIIVIGGCAGLILGNEAIRLSYSSGQMEEFFEAIGFANKHAHWVSGAVSIACWALYFYLLELGVLYFKYIQAKGLRFYLKEDSLTSWLISYYQEKILHAFDSQHLHSPVTKLFLVSLMFALIAVLIMLAGGIIFGIWGLLGGALIALLFVGAVIWGIYHLQYRHYEDVFQAARHLANGDFEHLQSVDAGIYQPLYDELMRVSDSYQKALREGLASQVSKTQLISNVSHDLKTPIAGILSYSELISQSSSMEDIHSYAGRLENYASRLSALIEDLFNVAKATSGDIQLDLHDIDLSELVLQVESEWEDSLEERQLSVVFDLMPSAVLRLDPSHMVRIIDNLLANICKYSLEHSRVFISLQEENGLYLLIFKNTSRTQMDFSPEQIVERFVRGDSSRHESGSGLGLAIVKSFVEVMSGTFEVQIDGDLFKAVITFPVPPVPRVPMLPEDQPEAIEATEPDTLTPTQASTGQNEAGQDESC